jgi:hypothetical protein
MVRDAGGRGCLGRHSRLEFAARHLSVQSLWVVAVAAMAPFNGERVLAGELCPKGWWADAMIGSYHIHPDKHFDDFNPGAGARPHRDYPVWAIRRELHLDPADSRRSSAVYRGLAVEIPIPWAWLARLVRLVASR